MTPQPITSAEQLFTQWHRGLFLEAFRILQKVEDAEDCLQEAAIRMIRAWHTCNPATAQAWAFTIVRNVAKDMIRRRRARTEETEQPFDHEPAIPSHEGAILARVTIANALSRLKPRERQAFTLWQEGYRSLSAVGGAMKMREFHAVHQMRRLLAA